MKHKSLATNTHYVDYWLTCIQRSPPDSYRGYRGYSGLLLHLLCHSATVNANANGTSRETVTTKYV